MLSFFIGLAAFLVAILALVSLHELGHLVVAVLCGVKVKRFCIGFGEPFWSKKWKGIEWCLSPLPLGGYVSMLDGRDATETIPEEDLPRAFDRQSPLKKMAIVLAGPLTNLVLAVALYFAAAYGYGVDKIRPLVGTVIPQTIAQRAGFQPDDRIESVNGEKVEDFVQAMTSIAMSFEAGDVTIAVTDAAGQKQNRVIDREAEREAIASVVRGGAILGITPSRLLPVIAEVEKGSPAERAGLRPGDRVVEVDGKPVESWLTMQSAIRSSPGVLMRLEVERDGKALSLNLRPESREFERYKPLAGYAGIVPQADAEFARSARRTEHPGFAGAWAEGARQTAKFSAMTLSFIGKLFVGDASMANLSGPVTIADLAGKTASIGLKSYLEFLALVSVSLGVLNLFPIPVLDGGQFCYFLYEWVRGKPLSLKTQLLGFKIGWALMMGLMVIAIYNDMIRLFG